MENFLFVLSKNDNEAATRCFQFAKIAHEKGHHVDLFFIDGGVAWANKERNLNDKTDTGDCPNDYLPYLVSHEVKIGICTPCAKNRNMDEAQFFNNMQLDGGPHLIDMAADAKVFNFQLPVNTGSSNTYRDADSLPGLAASLLNKTY